MYKMNYKHTLYTKQVRIWLELKFNKMEWNWWVTCRLYSMDSVSAEASLSEFLGWHLQYIRFFKNKIPACGFGYNPIGIYLFVYFITFLRWNMKNWKNPRYLWISSMSSLTAFSFWLGSLKRSTSTHMTEQLNFW